MRRFRFPLASYERLLAHREDQAKLRVARAVTQRERALGLLDHLETRRQTILDERVERRSASELPPREELVYQSYFERMALAIDGQRGHVARAAAELGAQQRELREAATRHRLLGILRERRRAEHRAEAFRELTRVLDDVGARAVATRGPEQPPPAA
jgi:flagellar export protein FliJ